MSLHYCGIICVLIYEYGNRWRWNAIMILIWEIKLTLWISSCACRKFILMPSLVLHCTQAPVFRLLKIITGLWDIYRILNYCNKGCSACCLLIKDICICFNAYLKRNWDLVLVGTNGINGTLICVNGTSVPLTEENSEVINKHTAAPSTWESVWNVDKAGMAQDFASVRSFKPKWNVYVVLLF